MLKTNARPESRGTLRPRKKSACVLFLLIVGGNHFAFGKTDEKRQQKAARPNIVFFLSDDHRHDQLGCAGHPFLKTPNIDGLARRGVRFTHCFVTTSICAASRASLLTGQVERTHGYTFGKKPLDLAAVERTYPTVLKRAGYKTGFVGKLGVRFADRGLINRMFDFYRPILRSPYLKPQKSGPPRHTTDLCGDAAIKFLKDVKTQSKPFCLSISFSAPHAEDGDKKNHFPPPTGVAEMYADIKMPRPSLDGTKVFESQPEFLRNSMNRDRYFWRWDTPEKYDLNLRNYYRMLSGIDATIGRVLEQLDKLGFLENTVVIFNGDNGYYMGERGFAGKWSHYEESLRVPMIVCDPRETKTSTNRTCDNIVLNIDIPATIVDLSTQTPLDSFQGTSLKPFVDGTNVDTWRDGFFCEHLMDHKSIPKWEGVHESRYVYARYFEQEPPFEFLHDLETDPSQLTNLAGNPEHSKLLEKMRGKCKKLRDQFEQARVER